MSLRKKDNMKKIMLILLIGTCTRTFGQANILMPWGKVSLGAGADTVDVDDYKLKIKSSPIVGRAQVIIANGGTGTYDRARLDFNTETGKMATFILESNAAGVNANDFVIGNWAGGSIKMIMTEVERMRLTPDGKLGLGTNAPNIGGWTGNAFTVSGVGNVGLEVANTAAVTDGTNVGGTRFFAGNSASNMVGQIAVDLVGTTRNSGKIRLGTNNAGTYNDVLTITNTGNVGIGTTSPDYKLDVIGQIRCASNLTFTGTGVEGLMGSVIYNDPTNGFLIDRALVSNTSGAAPVSFVINKRGSTLANAAFIINAQDNVGIGTSSPGTYKLAVNGDIHAKKLVVDNNTWPDYVFSEDYPLKSLQSVELFIKKNKHLPDLPSAKEVEERGISVGDNQAVLLKKIEELTLYMIEMKKENDLLRQEISVIKADVKKIKK